MECLLRYGAVREDGRVLTGFTTVKGKRYPQWRKPEDFERRRRVAKARQIVGNLPPDKADHLRKLTKERNARRRAAKGEVINSQRRLAYLRDAGRVLAKNARWRKENWQQVLDARRRPNYAIAAKLRSRINGAIKAQFARKSASTINLIGCSIETLKAHLQSQFEDGMNWENYGQWHIDHILPCASFDLTRPEEQRNCFRFTNLQPLWGVDNLRKGSRIDSATR